MRGAALVWIMISGTILGSAALAQDNSQIRPPVSETDIAIVRKARQIVDSPVKWNRADDRVCPDRATKFSLYCALEKATLEATGDFAHRGAAMQEARFVIDEDLAPQNHYRHRLMDYNNDPRTTFRDVRRFFDLLQGRIEGRLEEQKTIVGLVTPRPVKVTRADIEVVKRVEGLLDSPAKWDKASTQVCRKNAEKMGLYCAFKLAAIAVTGKFDGRAPGVEEARMLISRTAPHAANYTARLVDYNNDPTVTFADVQRLLKRVEANLEKRMAIEAGRVR